MLLPTRVAAEVAKVRALKRSIEQKRKNVSTQTSLHTPETRRGQSISVGWLLSLSMSDKSNETQSIRKMDA